MIGKFMQLYCFLKSYGISYEKPEKEKGGCLPPSLLIANSPLEDIYALWKQERADLMP